MSLDKAWFQREVGRRLQRIRRSRKISQDDLADRVGVSRVTLSNIEMGRHSTQAFLLALAAMELDVDVGDLLPDPSEQDAGKLWFESALSKAGS